MEPIKITVPEDQWCNACSALVMDKTDHASWHAAVRLSIDDEVSSQLHRLSVLHGDMDDLFSRVSDLEDQIDVLNMEILQKPRTKRARTPDESFWRCMPVGVWFWYCEVHDAHGSAGSEEEAKYVLAHHAGYFRALFNSAPEGTQVWEPCRITVDRTVPVAKTTQHRKEDASS